MANVRKKLFMAPEEEPRGLDPTDGEPTRVTRRRKGGRLVKCFSGWIKNEALEK
jgi:hypothetical protein